jgi:signal transduction histidine kinase
MGDTAKERPGGPLWGVDPRLIALGGLLLAGGAAAVALSNTTGDHRTFLALVNAATIIVFVGVGAYAWRRDPDGGFGRLLVVAGVGWFFVSFAASGSPALYSVGRAAAWVEEVLIVYVFLSYPGGRLETRAARIVVGAGAAAVAFLYLPTVFLVDQFPSPSPYSLCAGAECASNAFRLTASQPAFVDDFVRPLRELIATGVFISTAGIIYLRLQRATPLMRRSLVPVLAVAGLVAVSAGAYLIARLAGASEPTLEALAIIRALAMPLAGLGFLVTVLDWQLYEARALERMALSAGASDVAPDRLQRLVREAFEDPTLELRLRNGAGWRDVDGNLGGLPPETLDRCILEVADTAIVCDPALKAHRRLVRAAGNWVAIETDREHLNNLLERSVRAVEDSRRRLATAAATERRRIERDLHDGAQQRLVTLRVQLELVEEELERDPLAGARRLHELGPSVDSVIEDVRSLARGIYPPLLADAGLVEALRAVAAREALPVTVEADQGVRYPLEVESAAYFCCLEALQNAAKHSGTDDVTITVSSDPELLRFSVSDRGCGFSGAARNGGSGLTNIRDRLAAVGGRLMVDSEPGVGTRVSGEVPVESAP